MLLIDRIAAFLACRSGGKNVYDPTKVAPFFGMLQRFTEPQNFTFQVTPAREK